MVKDLDSIWAMALLRAANKMDAVCIKIAKSLGISPLRYNELAIEVNKLIDSTSGPTEFWEVVDDRRKQLFLNDAESMLFGAMLCSVVVSIRKSVYF